MSGHQRKEACPRKAAARTARNGSPAIVASLTNPSSVMRMRAGSSSGQVTQARPSARTAITPAAARRSDGGAGGGACRGARCTARALDRRCFKPSPAGCAGTSRSRRRHDSIHRTMDATRERYRRVYWERQLDLIDEMTAPYKHPHAVLLDIGCGYGRNARRFAQGVERYIGLNIDEEELAAARQSHPEPKF